MAENKPNNQPMDDQSEPLIPPIFLLLIGFAGLLVAAIVAISQPQFNTVGFGGLGIAVLAFVAWALLSPQQAVAVFTGRTARFGGVSLFVTLLVLVALVFVYIFARNANQSIDLTQSDQFSLTDESRQAIAAFGADPNVPRVRILAFYGAGQASTRDQNQLLFQDYADTSGGKIEFQIVDPDRNPTQASLYGVTRAGQIVVVADNPALVGQPQTSNPDQTTDSSGSPFSLGAIQPDDTGFTADVEHARLLQSAAQQDLTNAILRVSASGDFTAYFLSVADSEEASMSSLKQTLTEGGGWTVTDTSLLAFTGPNPEHVLNDPNLDGEVMVIPGGTGALSADELATLQTYLDNGGDLVIFAGSNFISPDFSSLATDTALNDYLETTFGLRINNDLVMDDRQAAQNALTPIITDVATDSTIMTGFAQPVLIFDQTHSISVSDAAPANVTVTALARTSENAWTTTDFTTILDGSYQTPADVVRGAQVVAASAENTQTGARIVVFGSTTPAIDDLAQYSNFANFRVAVNSLVWTTHFDDFARQITVQQTTDPSQLPMSVSEQSLRDINLLTLFVLPFGMLGIGVYVWWMNRERRNA